LEINLKRLRNNKNLRLLTLTEVADVKGEAGNYSVTLKAHPRYINENCTACGACGEAVKAEFADEHNYSLSKRKGAYLPNATAFPQRYVLDSRIIGTADAEAAKAACKFNAIDLDMQDETKTITVGAIIWATGWRPFDANKIQPYGYDRYPNVITSVEFERLADPHGPTGGKLLRPSDGKEAKNVAFIQCAGSRDRNYLKHCSRICCMASLKQAIYVSEKWADAGSVSIYYIDIRALIALMISIKKSKPIQK
jgi:quinone-modifying oxidoreductase subunit QmoA